MRYRKKPVVIDAIQFTGDNIAEIWDAFGAGEVYGPTEQSASTFIDTAEGRMEAKPGDWIIRGVKSELYPCKPDIFEATYDPVTGLTDEPRIIDLVGCARCHGDGHNGLEFHRLTFPVPPDDDGTPWTHWAHCPTNGEPILMRITDTATP